MLPPNLPSNHSLVRPLMHVLPTLKIMLVLIFVQGGFGTLHRMHFLMYGFSTQTHPVIVLPVVSSAYRRHEQAKKREYGQRVRDVEHGVFTPLVLSTTGGMGKEATTFYKRLADMIAQKRQHPYSVMGWLRCRLSFASLRSSIMCIRGSRSSLYRPIYSSDISLASSEGHVPPL